VNRKIVELMQLPTDAHDMSWLRQSLQAALELELSTLPPYLCGLWSIKSQDGPAFDRIEQIALQEMAHLGLTCNMLASLGSAPRIVEGYVEIIYPGFLPGGVRPQLTVYLSGLTKNYIKDVFMEIEYPENGPIALAIKETFPTIGDFYDAILEAFDRLKPSLSTTNQLASSVGVSPLSTIAEVENAIKTIKEQGEGTSQSPNAPGSGNQRAHYYEFAEIYHGKELIKTEAGWDYAGAVIPFPEVYSMSPIPAGGYQSTTDAAKRALTSFNLQFTSVLTNLQEAWVTGRVAKLNSAVAAMGKLQGLADALFQIPLPGGIGVYGPNFLLAR
jgi:hypothetical protein